MNPTLLRATRLAKQQLPTERRLIPAHSSARDSDVILSRRQFVGSTAGTSSSDFAEFGKERNGVFFNSDDS